MLGYSPALLAGNRSYTFMSNEIMDNLAKVGETLNNAPAEAKAAFNAEIAKQMNARLGTNATKITDIKLEGKKAKVFYEDDAGQINVIEMGMAVLAIVIVVSIYIVFKVVFPSTAGQTILAMNVTSTNPMYDTVQQAASSGSSLFGMTDILMYILIIVVIAAFAFGIFKFRQMG